MHVIKVFFIAIFSFISICGCGLPPIQRPPASELAQIHCNCQSLFPKDRLQLVHSLTSILPNGDIAVAVGVTTISPKTKTIHCAIMTIEGMILFEAEYNQKINVLRSVPPFDSPEFAQNIISDIQLVFFPPHGKLIDAGRLPAGSDICRYQLNTGMTIDIIINQNNDGKILQYNARNQRIKTIQAYFADPDDHGFSKKNRNIPFRYEITTHGIFGYSLKLELIEVQRNPLE